MYEKKPKQRFVNVYDLERRSVVKEDGSRYVPWLAIAELETAEAVVHAEWEEKKVYGVCYDFCSVCGECKPGLNTMSEPSKKNFCPNCGARMEE